MTFTDCFVDNTIGRRMTIVTGIQVARVCGRCDYCADETIPSVAVRALANNPSL